MKRKSEYLKGNVVSESVINARVVKSRHTTEDRNTEIKLIERVITFGVPYYTLPSLYGIT